MTVLGVPGGLQGALYCTHDDEPLRFGTRRFLRISKNAPSKDRGGKALASPEAAEERPHVTDQEVGFLHGSEVAAAVELGPLAQLLKHPEWTLRFI